MFLFPSSGIPQMSVNSWCFANTCVFIPGLLFCFRDVTLLTFTRASEHFYTVFAIIPHYCCFQRKTFGYLRIDFVASSVHYCNESESAVTFVMVCVFILLCSLLLRGFNCDGFDWLMKFAVIWCCVKLSFCRWIALDTGRV